MFRKLVAIFLPTSLGIVMVALVLTVGEIGAEEQGVGGIEINGLLWGDGDYLDYTRKGEAEAARGFLYIKSAGPDLLQVLVRVSYTVNDNVFSPTKTSYVRDIGFEEGYNLTLGWNPGHDIIDLVQTDQLQIFIRCGAGAGSWTYFWVQDLAYNNNETILPPYDWRSDQLGGDGIAEVSSDPTNHPVPPGGIVITSHSSLEYNLENSSWILITQTNKSPNAVAWMSPDVASRGLISLTIPPTDVNAITGIHEDYPFYLSTGPSPTDLYEWPLNYEMLLDTSACGANPVYLGVLSAHSSPSKDGNEDVPIPTAVTLSFVKILDSGPNQSVILVAAGLLAIATSMVLIRRRYYSKE
jgi:hypothetical protein